MIKLTIIGGNIQRAEQTTRVKRKKKKQGIIYYDTTCIF